MYLTSIAVRPLIGALTAATTALALCAGAWAQAPAAPVATTAPAAATSASSVPAADVPAKGAVEKLGWMVGCWRANSVRDGSTINEVWLAPRVGTMMGLGQTYLESRTLGWEAMRIYDAGDSMKLWLRPGARPEMTMDLVEVTPMAAGFSITEAGTTTKLRYERTNDTTLLATFRLIKGEDRRGADFSFNRVECTEMFAAAVKEAPKATPAESPKQ